jgi:nucleoside transporter
MDQQMSMNVRMRLSAMMFLQYMMFAVWWQPLAAYLTNMDVAGMYKATILSSMALGCLVAPLICMIADRHFASQKVLTALNFLCAVLFFLAAKTTTPAMLFVALLFAMFCYMPTWSLTSAIAMANSPSEKFPQIRVFGSIGWVASAVFSIVAAKFYGGMKIDGTAIPLMCGAGTALVAGFVNLTLPNTPPPAKGQKASIVDALGLRALTLMKDRNFAIFMILSMLVMIPFTIYWSFGSQFLQDKGFEYITLTMNMGQFVEMFLMLLVPFALMRLGLKWTIITGLVALVVRYLAFWAGGATDQNILYFVAIWVHGIIFGFFFVGGQVYVDKKAPPQIRAQAQGLIFLICFGIGMLAGNYGNAALIEMKSDKSEPVAADYTMPTQIRPDALDVPGAKLSDIRLYGRALNATEVAVLHARDVQKDAAKSQRFQDSAEEPVKLDEGLLAAGDTLSALAGKAPQNEVSISAVLSLPAGKEPLSGTLMAIGSGDNAMALGVEEDKLYYRADSSKIAYRLKLPRGQDEAGNDKSIHIVGTFDGSLLRLYTDGSLYKRVRWNPIWMITSVCSVVLLAAFIFLFRDDVKTAAPAQAAV